MQSAYHMYRTPSYTEKIKRPFPTDEDVVVHISDGIPLCGRVKYNDDGTVAVHYTAFRYEKSTTFYPGFDLVYDYGGKLIPTERRYKIDPEGNRVYLLHV